MGVKGCGSKVEGQGSWEVGLRGESASHPHPAIVPTLKPQPLTLTGTAGAARRGQVALATGQSVGAAVVCAEAVPEQAAGVGGASRAAANIAKRAQRADVATTGLDGGSAVPHEAVLAGRAARVGQRARAALLRRVDVAVEALRAGACVQGKREGWLRRGRRRVKAGARPKCWPVRRTREQQGVPAATTTRARTTASASEHSGRQRQRLQRVTWRMRCSMLAPKVGSASA